MDPTTGIPAAELLDRRQRLLEHVRGLQLTGYALFGDDYIRYFTGFNFLATERPVAVVGNSSGDLAVFVPEFEVERVRAETAFELIESYPEYPGTDHPLRILAGVLRELGVTGPAGADQDGYPGILGYQGPALSEATGQHVVPLAPFIESMMVRKSDAEVGLIRESARSCAPAAAAVHPARHHRGRGQPAGGARGHASDAVGARRLLRRPAGLVRRRLGRVPRPDRPAERLGARGRP